MRAPSLLRVGALAGLVVAGGATIAVVTSGVRHSPAQPDPEARSQFVAAYERSRRATYVVESTFERRMDTGGVLSSAQMIAQRPPDRLVRQFGGIDGILGGKAVLCTTDPSGSFGCQPGPTSRDFEAEVRDEVNNVRDYVSPPAPIYRVEHQGDCFSLTQVIVYPNPPFGSSAKFCFDEQTGAPTAVERRLENATERLEAISIRSTVTDTDLSVEARDKFAARMSEPPGSSTSSTSPDSAPASTTQVPGSADSSASSIPEPSGSLERREGVPTRRADGSSESLPGGVAALPEVALLTNPSLIERGSTATQSGPYVDEALTRIRGFTLSVNDPNWREADGAPVRLWDPVARRLLADGTARW